MMIFKFQRIEGQSTGLHFAITWRKVQDPLVKGAQPFEDQMKRNIVSIIPSWLHENQETNINTPGWSDVQSQLREEEEPKAARGIFESSITRDSTFSSFIIPWCWNVVQELSFRMYPRVDSGGRFLREQNQSARDHEPIGRRRNPMKDWQHVDIFVYNGILPRHAKPISQSHATHPTTTLRQTS